MATIKPSLGAVAPAPLSRDALTAAAFLLLLANAAAGFAIESVAARGVFIAVVNLFDIGAIIWLAMAAALSLLWRSADLTTPDQADWAFALAAALIALLPVATLSAAALTVAGLWVIVRSNAGSARRRAALIILSLSTFFFWGRLVLAMGSGPLLALDAQFVSLLSGLPAKDNVVSFADGQFFMIAPGCSSLHGISQAVILWTTAIAWFGLALTKRLWGTLCLAVLASILVNGIRLAIIGWNPRDFDYWHVGAGAMLIGYLALTAIALVIYQGIKNARAAA